MPSGAAKPDPKPLNKFLSLNEALPIYRVWLHGDLPYSDVVVHAKDTIETEAELRDLTFEQLVDYRADQSGEVKGPK
jgi:hypothetical protein